MTKDEFSRLSWEEIGSLTNFRFSDDRFPNISPIKIKKEINETYSINTWNEEKKKNDLFDILSHHFPEYLI